MTDGTSWEFSDALAFDFDGYGLTIRDRCNRLHSYNHNKYEIKLIVTKRSVPVKVGDVITDKSVMEALPPRAIVLDSDEDPWQKSEGSFWYFKGGDRMTSDDMLADFSPLTVLYLPISR